MKFEVWVEIRRKNFYKYEVEAKDKEEAIKKIENCEAEIIDEEYGIFDYQNDEFVWEDADWTEVKQEKQVMLK